MLQKSCKLLLSIVFCTAIFTSTALASPFNIDLSFSGSYTNDQRDVFAAAEHYWESTLDYQGDIEISSLVVDVQSFDGDPYGTIGWGGWTDITKQDGFVFSTEGRMSFDTADVSRLFDDGRLYDVILHELAHVMGFGTLWENGVEYWSNGLYVPGSYQYTGANALAAYQAEYDADATFVPVENGGGGGTIDAHWEEDIFDNELMTGWLDPGENPISSVTLASFVDLGYELVSVPVPSALLLFGAGLLSLVGIKRRNA